MCILKHQLLMVMLAATLICPFNLNAAGQRNATSYQNVFSDIPIGEQSIEITRRLYEYVPHDKQREVLDFSDLNQIIQLEFKYFYDTDCTEDGDCIGWLRVEQQNNLQAVEQYINKNTKYKLCYRAAYQSGEEFNDQINAELISQTVTENIYRINDFLNYFTQLPTHNKKQAYINERLELINLLYKDIDHLRKEFYNYTDEIAFSVSQIGGSTLVEKEIECKNWRQANSVYRDATITITPDADLTNNYNSVLTAVYHLLCRGDVLPTKQIPIISKTLSLELQRFNINYNYYGGTFFDQLLNGFNIHPEHPCSDALSKNQNSKSLNPYDFGDWVNVPAIDFYHWQTWSELNNQRMSNSNLADISQLNLAAFDIYRDYHPGLNRTIDFTSDPNNCFEFSYANLGGDNATKDCNDDLVQSLLQEFGNRNDKRYLRFLTDNIRFYLSIRSLIQAYKNKFEDRTFVRAFENLRGLFEKGKVSIQPSIFDYDSESESISAPLSRGQQTDDNKHPQRFEWACLEDQGDEDSSFLKSKHPMFRDVIVDYYNTFGLLPRKPKLENNPLSPKLFIVDSFQNGYSDEVRLTTMETKILKNFLNSYFESCFDCDSNHQKVIEELQNYQSLKKEFNGYYERTKNKHLNSSGAEFKFAREFDNLVSILIKKQDKFTQLSLKIATKSGGVLDASLAGINLLSQKLNESPLDKLHNEFKSSIPDDSQPSDQAITHGIKMAMIAGAKCNRIGIFGLTPNSKIIALERVHLDRLLKSVYRYDNQTTQNCKKNNPCLINISLSNITLGSEDEKPEPISEKFIAVIAAGNYEQIQDPQTNQTQCEIDEQHKLNIQNNLCSKKNDWSCNVNGKNILRVAALDHENNLACWSGYHHSYFLNQNREAVKSKNTVHIAAPGNMYYLPDNENKLVSASGTSYASIAVASVMSEFIFSLKKKKLVQDNDKVLANKVRNRLLYTADLHNYKWPHQGIKDIQYALDERKVLFGTFNAKRMFKSPDKTLIILKNGTRLIGDMDPNDERIPSIFRDSKSLNFDNALNNEIENKSFVSATKGAMSAIYRISYDELNGSYTVVYLNDQTQDINIIRNISFYGKNRAESLSCSDVNNDCTHHRSVIRLKVDETKTIFIKIDQIKDLIRGMDFG